MEEKKKNEFIPHLNVQNNSNLGFSLLTNKQLIDLAVKLNIDYLAISDFFFFGIRDFFRECLKFEIKPIVGIKIFFKTNYFEHEEKIRVTVFPLNNNGFKKCLKKVFGWNSPKDRIFFLEKDISFFGQNCIVIFENNSLDELQRKNSLFSEKEFKEKVSPFLDNIFLGFDFYIFSHDDKQPLKEEILEKLVPFFSVKYEKKNDKKIFSLFEQAFLNNFPFEDKKNNSHHYFDLDHSFSLCTNDKKFFSDLLERWKKIVKKIVLIPKSLLFIRNKKESEESFLNLKKKCTDILITKKSDDETKKKIFGNLR